MSEKGGFFRKFITGKPRDTFGEVAVSRSGMQLEEGDRKAIAERISRVSHFVTLVNGEIFETKLEEFKREFAAASAEEQSALQLAVTSVAQDYRERKEKEAGKEKNLDFIYEPYAGRADALEKWVREQRASA